MGAEYATGRALVSIGVPVYNGAAQVASAIEALLAQDWPNIEIIISDNTSTDATAEICRAFAARDSRVLYVRQAQNIGASGNFHFVLQQARGKYFFWNAADDTRSPDFVSANVKFLEAHPDFVASVSKARDDGGTFNPRWMGDRVLDQDSAEQRVLTYFKGWHRNAVFYSIYRRELLVDNPQLYAPEFLGQDWAVVIGLLQKGKFARLEQGEVIIGRGGTSNRSGFLRRMRRRPIEFLAPHWVLSTYVMRVARDYSWAARTRLLWRVILLDIRANLGRFIGLFGL